MTTGSGEHTSTQPAGFWKIRHAVIGLAAVTLLTIVVVRSCGGDSEDEQAQAGAEGTAPRQAVAVQVPASRAPGLYPPAQSPAYGYPQQQQQPAYGYPQQQQPAYGYPQQQQQQPAYGYPQQQQQQPAYGYPQQQQQQPAYGYPQQQQQQPAYGYPQQQQQQPAYGYPQQQQPAYGYSAQPSVAQPPQYTATDPQNPWTMQQPAYGYGGQPAPRWGEPQRQQPVYAQPPGGGQYRPLDQGLGSNGQQSRTAPAAAPPATVWSAAPYDRRGGSSFGTGNAGTSGYPYGTAYPGYYGATPYGLPGGYGAGWPGVGYPGIGWPMVW